MISDQNYKRKSEGLSKRILAILLLVGAAALIAIYNANYQTSEIDDQIIESLVSHQTVPDVRCTLTGTARSYDEWKTQIEAKGGRLPTADEARKHWVDGGKEPLFNVDVIWVPVTSHSTPNKKDYFYAGFTDCIQSCFGQTYYERLSKFPIWANDNGDHQKGACYVSDHDLFQEVGNIVCTLTRTARSYDEWKTQIEAKGGRLPTADEARKHWVDGDKEPLFTQDMWVPVTDPSTPNKKGYFYAGNHVCGGPMGSCFGQTYYERNSKFPTWADNETTGGHKKGACYFSDHNLFPEPENIRCTLTSKGSRTFNGWKTWIEAKGGRMPTQEELYKHWVDGGKLPLLKYSWLPVTNKSTPNKKVYLMFNLDSYSHSDRCMYYSGCDLSQFKQTRGVCYVVNPVK